MNRPAPSRLHRGLAFLAAVLPACVLAGCDAESEADVPDRDSVTEEVATTADALTQSQIDEIEGVIAVFIASHGGTAGPAVCVGWTGSATQFGRHCSGKMRLTPAQEQQFPPATTLATDHTLFRVGSISKTFTGALLAARRLDALNGSGCGAAGSICYDQTLVPHLDIANWSANCGPNHDLATCNAKAGITLRQLATHQASLPRNGNLYPNVTYGNAAMVDEFVTSDPIVTPTAYSNLGFALLSRALEDGTTVSYRNQVKNRFLTPLGMVDTVVVPPASLFPRLAQAPGAVVGAADPWGPAYDGAALWHSTLDDMMTWLRWYESYVPTPTGVDGAVRSETLDNGLGWVIKPNWNVAGTTLAEKPGSAVGFESYVGLLRGQGKGVVVLVAGADTDPTGLGEDLLQIMQ